MSPTELREERDRLDREIAMAIAMAITRGEDVSVRNSAQAGHIVPEIETPNQLTFLLKTNINMTPFDIPRKTRVDLYAAIFTALDGSGASETQREAFADAIARVSAEDRATLFAIVEALSIEVPANSGWSINIDDLTKACGDHAERLAVLALEIVGAEVSAQNPNFYRKPRDGAAKHVEIAPDFLANFFEDQAGYLRP